MTTYCEELTEEKQTAEEYLIHYAFIKGDLEQRRQTIIESSPSLSEVPTREKYAHGNPTYSKVVRLTRSDLLQKERWLKAVDATKAHYAGMDTNHALFITERYGLGMHWTQIARDLGICVDTVARLRHDVLKKMIGFYRGSEEEDAELFVKQNFSV